MSLKKYLQQFSKEQLIGQIIELNVKYKEVKAYYEFSLNPNSNKAKEETKKIIGKCISTDIGAAGPDLKLREARKAITNFKKLSPSESDLADVMLFYAECGIEYTIFFGDIGGSFYDSIVGMFYDACKHIKANGIQAQFMPRCKQTADKTATIGWGLHDALSGYCRDFFDPPEKAD